MARALAAVVGQPSLWLIGSLAFALRGGLLFLLASIVVLPTPVEVRMLLGSNLGSAGLAPDFVRLLTAAAGVLALVLVAALAALAYLELHSFERLLRDPEVGQAIDSRRFRSPTAGQRRWLLLSLFGVQLLAFLGLVAAAIPLINGTASVAYQEIIRPSLGGTIYVRVLNGVLEPLFILLGGLVLTELISSVATRRVLLRGFGLAGGRPPAGLRSAVGATLRALGGGLLRPLGRPLSTVFTLSLVWSASLAVLLPMTWALSTAWSAVRSAYLAPLPAADAQQFVGLLAVTLALGGLWLTGLLLGGFVSALRAALWSVEALR